MMCDTASTDILLCIESAGDIRLCLDSAGVTKVLLDSAHVSVSSNIGPSLFRTPLMGLPYSSSSSR